MSKKILQFTFSIFFATLIMLPVVVSLVNTNFGVVVINEINEEEEKQEVEIDSKTKILSSSDFSNSFQQQNKKEILFLKSIKIKSHLKDLVSPPPKFS